MAVCAPAVNILGVADECDDPHDTLTVAEADSNTVEVLENISPNLSPPQEEVEEVDSGDLDLETEAMPTTKI